jgi:hypothetical protein
VGCIDLTAVASPSSTWTSTPLGVGAIKTHVNHIFAKLGLRDRAAALVLVFDGAARSNPFVESVGLSRWKSGECQQDIKLGAGQRRRT